MKAQDAVGDKPTEPGLWDGGPRDHQDLLKDLQYADWGLCRLTWRRPMYEEIGPPEGTPARAHWLERRRIRKARKKAR